MSGIILKGSRVSSEKIRARGFEFQYPDLKEALNSLLR
jgi:NAD dependent epimerase/dehydratase family enzyme